MGVDLVWFGILYLLCMQIGLLTPPFGLLLFVLKGVAPPGITIGNDLSRRDALCLADDADDGADLRPSRHRHDVRAELIAVAGASTHESSGLCSIGARAISTRRFRCWPSIAAARRSWPAAKA